jgi:hypothetical protein
MRRREEKAAAAASSACLFFTDLFPLPTVALYQTTKQNDGVLNETSSYKAATLKGSQTDTRNRIGYSFVTTILFLCCDCHRHCRLHPRDVSCKAILIRFTR